MSLPMIRIPGVPNAEDVKPGMAYFAGTGPDNKTCGECSHRGYYRKSKKSRWNKYSQQEEFRSYWVPKCEVYKSMTGKHGGNIDRHWPACKYFEPKKRTGE